MSWDFIGNVCRAKNLNTWEYNGIKMGIKWDFDGNEPKVIFRRGMSGNEAGNGNERRKNSHPGKMSAFQKNKCQKFLKQKP